MSEIINNYTLQNKNFFYFIIIKGEIIGQTLLIQIHNFIKKSSFSLNLNLTDLNNKNIKCRTINDAMIIFDTFFKRKQISVKEINDFEIILIINNFTNNYYNNYILLNLKLDSNNITNYLRSNESQNLSYFSNINISKIGSYNSSSNINNPINISKNQPLIELSKKPNNARNTITSLINQIDYSLMIIRFLKARNDENQKKDLKGLLKLCLLKKLSFFLNDLEDIKEIRSYCLKDISYIFKEIREYIHLFEEEKNLKIIIKAKKAFNILLYSYYLDDIEISSDIINLLINSLNNEQKNEINNYWKALSKYEEYNDFEEQFNKDLKNSHFDFSLISLNILERDNPEDYKINKNKCKHMKKKLVYHTSKIDIDSLKDGYKLKYPKESLYGMGIYSSDTIDYIASYCSNEKKGDIISVNSFFSFIASEIYYDESKLKIIENMNYSTKALDHYPSYNELKLHYPEKMVEPNGIHYKKIEKNDIFKSFNNNCFKEKNKFLGNEYIITEKNQIFPLFNLTLKRNEYFVLHRDPNFKGNNEFSTFLNNLKQYNKAFDMNFYYESSTEEALKFLLKRKYNKVILITSIGKDLSGKRFVEIARKILGFNIIVLFVSNNTSHFHWIKDFPNCLYTNELDIYHEYITNFNEEGLKELREKVIEKYQIKLKEFTFDFMLFPYYINNNSYIFSNLDFKNIYIRSVHIKMRNGKYLCMEDNGKVNIGLTPCVWDITLFNTEITLFSNGFYLHFDKKYNKNNKNKEKVIGYKYMSYWHFYKKDEFYYFMKKNEGSKNNYILSIEGGNIIKVKKSKIKNNNNLFEDNESFQLIDAYEDINRNSFISDKIKDVTSTFDNLNN